MAGKAGPDPASEAETAARAKVERLDPRSLRAKAYNEIKRRIITLEYRPGEYLNEALISSQLGIGRTPVHQALDRLMLEGMIEVIPRKGVIVRPVSLDEFLQLTEVRLVNEPYCARLAAERASEEDLAELAAVLARTEDRMAVRDIEGMMLLDREFHSTIARAAGNRVLAEILLTLHERSLRFWFISLSDAHHHRRVYAEHQAVYEAIRNRDAAAASAALRAHVESSRDNIVRSI